MIGRYIEEMVDHAHCPQYSFALQWTSFSFLVCVKKSSSEFHFKVEVWNVWLIDPVLLGFFDKELLFYSIFTSFYCVVKNFFKSLVRLKLVMITLFGYIFPIFFLLFYYHCICLDLQSQSILNEQMLLAYRLEAGSSMDRLIGPPHFMIVSDLDYTMVGPQSVSINIL